MVKLQFYPISVSYRIISHNAEVLLFGRTADKKQVCVIDSTFEPYFYVDPGRHYDKIKEALVKASVSTKDGAYSVTKVENAEKNFMGKSIKLLKATVNLPPGVPHLSAYAKDSLEAKETYETDILFVRRYMIDRKITPMTLCEAEGEFSEQRMKCAVFMASDVKQVSDDVLPEPRILSFDIETYSASKAIIPEENPVLMIGFYGHNFRKVITWKKFRTKHDYVELVNSELDLINRFREVIEQYKPDIITGYFSDGFDFPYLRTRAHHYKINLDLGLDYSPLRMGRGMSEIASISGIAHLDVIQFIKGVMRTAIQTDTYSLNAVAKEMIGEGKEVVDLDELPHVWDHKPEELDRFCEYNLTDARITFKLAESIFANIVELIKIVGLPLDDIIRMGFSQLVEWFYIRQAPEFNELVPNRPESDEIEHRRRQSYKGGFVFEPKPGLYKNIAVFDFRSLYPTIITAHNISPGTLNCDCCKNSAKKAPIEEGEKKEYWFCTKKKGFIPTLLEELITRRMRVNEIIKKGEENPSLTARSNALKTLANSAYGYYAFFGARWYSIGSAKSVTAWGRYYINKVIDEAKKKDFGVLYSDTDSIFLHLQGKNKDDAMKFAETINLNLPGLMELDLEDFYPSGIFVSAKVGAYGAKKKYALLSEKGKIKIRGFEAVRRNWSPIAKEVQEKVLDIVLNEGDAEKALKYVNGIIDRLRNKKIEMEKVVMSTQLQKEIKVYDSIGPHVAAAQRMKDKGYAVAPGSMIRFIVVSGKGRIRDRARLLDEVKEGEYDSEYYINNQVVPAVESILKVLGYDVEELIKSKDQSKLDSFFG